MAKEKSGRREQRPWFQMYPMDFFGSSKVARMSAEERGVFVTIMFRSWTDDGYVLDEEDLADELDITVERLREVMAGRVGRALYEDEEGRLRSRRLEEERKLADKQATTARANGSKGGRPKKKPSETQVVSGETQAVPSKTQAGPSETQPEVRCGEVRCGGSTVPTSSSSDARASADATTDQPPVADHEPDPPERSLPDWIPEPMVQRWSQALDGVRFADPLLAKVRGPLWRDARRLAIYQTCPRPAGEGAMALKRHANEVRQADVVPEVSRWLRDTAAKARGVKSPLPYLRKALTSGPHPERGFLDYFGEDDLVEPKATGGAA